MTDKDREALAAACAEHLKSGGDAITEAAFASGWQAALDSCAPKLTAAHALSTIAEAMRLRSEYTAVSPDTIDGSFLLGSVAISALKATGLRFREEP